jgi:hypothetical protein
VFVSRVLDRSDNLSLKRFTRWIMRLEEESYPTGRAVSSKPRPIEESAWVGAN